jgi:hypothetical protein
LRETESVTARRLDLPRKGGYFVLERCPEITRSIQHVRGLFMNPPVPPDWEKDSLSEFIETAHHNTIATFANLPNQYKVLKDIHDLYKYITDNLVNSPEWFASFFLLKSHSAYLGGVRLAISGQCAETYMVLRGCIEAAIYGLYLSRNQESQETWLNRHNNQESLRRVKDEFRIGKLLSFLESIDPIIHKVTVKLYELTIDYGAHPNELALTTLLRKEEKNGMVKFDLNYLSGDCPPFRLAVKIAAEVGLCSLYIFKNVYRERFAILGVDKKLDMLKTRLQKLLVK